MFEMEDKENDTKQENEKAGKLVGELTGQRPRRSVLKEFDPFAPDSPCAPIHELRNPSTIIDEEELFVDAETSLTGYLCPRTKNSTSSSENLKSPSKVTNIPNESLLIPDLKDKTPEKLMNPNDSADLSYVEAIDRTTSEEDFEFNVKKQTTHPEIIIQNLKNDSLNITANFEESDILNEGNIMVDSLEQTFDASFKQLNSTIENVQFSITLNEETQFSETSLQENNSNDLKDLPERVSEEAESKDVADILQVTENEHDQFNKGMIDSLELPRLPENIPVLENTLEKQSVCHEEILMDSLEISKPQEKLEKAPLVLGAHQVEETAHVDVHVNNSLETTSAEIAKSAINLPLSDQTNSAAENFKIVELDQTIEDLANKRDVVELNETSEPPSEKINDTAETLKTPELNTTFETLPMKGDVLIMESPSQMIGTNPDNANVNGERNNETVAPSSDTVESKTDSFQNNQTETNAPSDNNETVTPSSDTVESKTDSSQNNQTETNVPSDELQILELDPTFKRLPELNDILVVENANEATSSNHVELDRTFDTHENKVAVGENSIPNLECEETAIQSTECVCANDTQKKEDTESTLDKTFEASNKSEPENVGNTVSDDAELNKTFGASAKIEENVDTEEPTGTNDEQDIRKLEHHSIIENKSVSLQDIIDTDTSVKNDSVPGNTQETISNVQVTSSFEENSSKNAYSAVITAEHSAESSRMMEALAQSLNQTIDVEESAIEDDVNYSGDLSKEVLNATIENVNACSDTCESAAQDSEPAAQDSEPAAQDREPTAQDKEGMKSEEKAEKQNGNKVLVRKETEEFEDLERQYDEKAQNVEICDKKAVDGYDAVMKESGGEVVDKIGEQYSRTFQRQDTQEFEALERECKENVQNINDYAAKEVDDYTSAIENNGGLSEKKIKSEENVKTQDETKVLGKQNTQEFEDLEQYHKSNTRTAKVLSDGLKLSKETTQNTDDTIKEEESKTVNTKITGTVEEAVKEPVNSELLKENCDLPVNPSTTQVKVKVSGNICNAISEDSDQIDTKQQTQQYGINLKYDLIKNREKQNTSSDFEHKTVNIKAQNIIDVTMNGNNDIVSKKTDKAVAESGLDQTDTIIKNGQVQTSEHIAKPKSRPECRPSTRSIRNKTQVIDKPVFTNDIRKEPNEEHSNNETNLIPNDCDDDKLNECKKESNQLKNQVDRLQNEIEAIKKENMKKDKYILTCALDIEVERGTIVRYKKLVGDYELVMAKQNAELQRLKDESEKNAKHFMSSEMAFADVFEKYEKTKIVVEAYRKNEEILQKNIQSAEDQLTKLEAKCSVMKEQYTGQIKKAYEQMTHEKEKYRQDIAKLQAMVKRLEIKASSLETSLRQKTKECQELAALWDDNYGEPNVQ